MRINQFPPTTFRESTNLQMSIPSIAADPATLMRSFFVLQSARGIIPIDSGRTISSSSSSSTASSPNLE